MTGPLILTRQHAITFGGLPLMSNGKPHVHAGGFTTEVSVDGTTWGNPEITVATLISELTDGELVEETHVGNRQPVLYVRLSASTHAGLVAGDTALSQIVGGPAELVWQPPTLADPATVIDVVHSRMDRADDEHDWVRRQRTWILTLSAFPWPRSANQVSSPAVSAVAPTVLDTGGATTNWTTTNGTVSVVSGAVTATYNPSFAAVPGLYGSALVRNFPAPVTTTANKFLAVDWKTSIASLISINYINGAAFTNLPEVRREPGATGYTRSWFKLTDATTSLQSFMFANQHPSNAAASATLAIDQVLLANALPASGTARQQSRVVVPGGNVPAQGTILVQHETEGLGSVVVYSHPIEGGYSPPLRQWRVAGDTASAADATTVSGVNNALTTFSSFDIPIASVPQGDVHLWGRLMRNAVGPTTFSGAAYSATAPGVFVGASQPFSTTVNFGAQYVWAMVPLARFTLPTARIGMGGVVQIDIIGPNAFMDELWLFAMDNGRLTVLECGSGTPSPGPVANRLALAAATRDEPHGSIKLATRADFADSWSPNVGTVISDQTNHRFSDTGTMIFVVASGPATAVSTSLEHYPRWRAEAGS